MHERSLVSVVDDDPSVRESLPDLLRQLGFVAQAFSSAEAFLASEVVSETCCLIYQTKVSMTPSYVPGRTRYQSLMDEGALGGASFIAPLSIVCQGGKSCRKSLTLYVSAVASLEKRLPPGFRTAD
jgi:hypothetical protein